MTEDIFVIPASFAQQRLWVLDRLEPASSAFNMSAAVRLTGNLDIEALGRSLAEIVRRHESLRTIFADVNGEPMQVIATRPTSRLPLMKLNGASKEEREARAMLLISEEARRPFNLAEGPLLRTELLRLDSDSHVLLLTMHHIISDGWSIGVFIREMMALYKAFSTQQLSPLNELRIQYADFALWQRERMQGVILEDALRYWRNKLAGELPALQMPMDYTRPVLQTYRGERERMVLPEDLCVALRRMVVGNGVTLFMTLLAAFKTLLHRYTGQEDILVGTPIAGRDRAETADLIGCFLNTLVLRADLSGAPTFRELLRRVKEMTLEAYTYQELPFEKLLEELQPERALSHTPIFQVFFNMLNFPDSRIELPGLTVELLTPLEVESKFDLTLYVKELERGIQFDLIYNADLFAQGRMSVMLEQLKYLLSQIVENPDKRLAEYSLAHPAAATLLPNPIEPLDDSWVGAAHTLFSEQARRTPEKTAVSDKLEVWSYRELDAVSNRLANRLRESGIGAGDVVALYGHRSCPLVWGLLGILKAGAAFTILDPAYPSARLIDCLKLAKPRGWLKVEAAGDLPAALDQYLETLPLHCRIELSNRATVEARGFLAGFSAADPGVTVGPDDMAYIAFTSGSTGTPKGIVGRHGPLTHFIPWLKETFDLSESDRFSMLSGISHDPLQRDIFTPLALGAAVCIPDPDAISVPGGVAEWMASEAVSVANLTPAMGQLITETGRGGKSTKIESLRHAFFIGDMLTRNDVARLRKLATAVTVINFYGSTETQRALGYYVVPDGECGSASDSAKEILPLGRGIKDVQLLVLNAAGRLAGVGEIGEIFLRSPHLARGYLADESLTAEKFLINPFTSKTGDRVYRTGDLGRYMPDGNVEPLGRADSQVKIRGFRVELGEIEATLVKHPAVCEAVVIAREDEPGRKRLVGYIVAEEGQSVTTSDLRAYLRERLPEYMTPSAFVMLDRLPVTPNGKLDRSALPRPDDAPSIVVAPFVAPRSVVEELLAAIWTQVLNLESIGVEDNFFELGGHSLLATQALSRIRETFGVEVGLRKLFLEPTVAGLAQAIDIALRDGKDNGEVALSRRKEEGGPIPLSFAQQRMWFLDQLEPGNPFYNISAAVRLSGPLNVAALERSFEEILRRHEALRTIFTMVDGQAAQVVTPSKDAPLRIEDLSQLAKLDLEPEVMRRAEEEAQRGFDLARGPLTRLRLLRLRKREHVALLTMHHIVSDGWSSELFIQEMASLYEAFSKGESSPLAELPIQYSDFALWQREWLKGERLEAQLAYWARRLGGAPAMLELPIDRPRPAVQTFRGARHQLVLGRELSESLKILSREEGVTLFMTLLAAFNALLHRYTGAEDISVGTPIAGRRHVVTERLIGFFSNTLVLRADLTGDPSFGELLARVRDVALGAYAHQDAPFEMLVDALRPARSLSHTPLFQVALALQNMPAPALEAHDLRVIPLEIDNRTSKFDLLLTVRDSEDGLRCWLQYNTDLFHAPTIARLGDHLRNLLDSAVEESGQRLSCLSLLTDKERTQLLYEWNDVNTKYSSSACLHELFEWQAARRPDAVAVMCGGEQITYGEINSRASRLARRLRANGVSPEILVGVFLERSPEMVLAILAILKAGAAYVPCDSSQPVERLYMILEDSKARLLLTTRRMIEKLQERSLPVACQVVSIDAEAEEMAGTGEVGGRVAVNADNLAYVIYTSGSTGRPKGVSVTHANVTRLFSATEAWFHFDESDVWTLFHSYAFDFSVWEIWGALLYGGRLVVAPYWVSRSTEDFHGLVRRERVTVLNQTPSAFRQFIQADRTICDDRRLALRLVIFGGEALEPQSLSPWVERRGDEFPRLINMYGITETTVHVTYQPITEADIENEAGSVIGRPIPDLQVYVLDERMESAPVGVRGEMYVGGPGIARGYLNAPELSAQRFVVNPFNEGAGERLYRTGDLARFLADGRLEYLGRRDHQVKIRGFRIELGEIEAALAKHPSIKEALVMAEEGRSGEKNLVAYFVGKETPPSVGELRGFLSQKLPEYMTPHAFVALDAFPLTPNGKIDREALREAGREKADAGADFVAANSRVEKTLAEIWSQVLGVERVGVHDNFFEMGGDSILCIQVTAKANQAGIRISPKQLFQRQTIAELAEIVETQATRAIERTSAAGPFPLTPIQRHFFEENHPEPSHYNQSVLLEIEPPIDQVSLEESFNLLLNHHDALRLRYSFGDGGWRQTGTDDVEKLDIKRVNLSSIPEVRQAAIMEEIASTIQANLNIKDGPLVRVALFDLGPGKAARLLIAIHHLVVDGVSWRILLEDLQDCYERLSRGASPALPPKTTSFKQWAETLEEYARSDRLDSEISYWLEEPSAPVNGLAPDNHSGAPTVASARTVTLKLTAEETSGLSHGLPALHRTQINDALLAALAGAFKKRCEAGLLLIELEGHGREEIAPGIDVSRTVGWFTSLFPVLLDVRGAEHPIAALKAVKEQLRSIPKKGIGYGALRYLRNDAIAEKLREQRQPEVRFNYLGQFDQISIDATRFRAARESGGDTRSLKARLGRPLEINSRIIEAQLEVSWRFSENTYQPARIEKLAETYMEELRELINLCRSAEVCLHTPSDFPSARLDQATIDQLCASGPKVDDIYSLSMLQQGLLFHSLQDIQAKIPDVGFLYLSCTLRGPLDVGAFRRAWEEVIRRRDILRASFIWNGVDEPLQIVRDRVEAPFEEDDWRRLSISERRERAKAYLQSNRQNGFDLSKAPLTRFALFRVDDEAYQFIWSYHHIIVDGWSVAILIKEALLFYELLGGGRDMRLEPSRPYSDYIGWLLRQDLGAAETYWRAALNGVSAPTSLDNIRPPAHTQNHPEHYGEHSMSLTPEERERLQAFARSHQLTLNTLILGAWALLLSHYSVNDDVVFGVVVSGRPADLAGAETMVGLMINTLPFRTQTPAEEELRLWLKGLQERQVEMRQYEYSPLAQVQRWSEVRGGKPLFESLLNFMNYPVDEAVQEWKGPVEVDDLRYEERVSYPLNLVISVRKGVELKFKYDRRRFGASPIARALSLLRAVLNEFAERPDVRLGAIKRFIDESVREQESEQRKEFREARRKTLQNAKLKRTANGPLTNRKS